MPDVFARENEPESSSGKKGKIYREVYSKGFILPQVDVGWRKNVMNWLEVAQWGESRNGAAIFLRENSFLVWLWEIHPEANLQGIRTPQDHLTSSIINEFIAIDKEDGFVLCHVVDIWQQDNPP